MNILITGAAGFIGANLSSFLLKKGINVIGIDNFNDYYDPQLKEDRIINLTKFSERNFGKFELYRGDIADEFLIEKLFKKYNPEVVINLAAQAGVRYSIQNPEAYIQSNIVGFHKLLSISTKYKVKHF